MHQNIFQLYEGSVKNNLSDIKSFLTQTGLYSKSSLLEYEDILESTAKDITNKWKTGQKYVRTKFILEAFKDLYPNEVLRLSLFIDAQVNILDDLIDEELKPEEKVSYILEFLRIYSAHQVENSSTMMQIDLSKYFNKLISLAIAEKNILDDIKKQINLEEIINSSISLLSCRSYDIDIFTELPLDYIKKSEYKDKITKIARVFRSLNILKKDILDIESDMKKGQETVLTYMINKKEYSFNDYIKEITERYRSKACEEYNSVNTKTKIKSIFINFSNMIDQEINDIKKLLK
jgi:hypothetical protein